MPQAPALTKWVPSDLEAALRALQAAAGEEGAAPAGPLELDVFGKKLVGESVERLTAAVKSTAAGSRVQVLNLSTNKMGNRGATAVASLIAESKTLHSVDLRMNRIATQGAERLALSLKSAEVVLTTLHLSSNDMGTQGAIWMASALASNSSLRALFFEYNDIGDEGAAHVATALAQNRHLSTLSLRGNEINGSGALKLAESLKQNKSLTSLDMSTNAFGDAGAAAFEAAFRSNASLLGLMLFGCEVSPGASAPVRAALERNRLRAERAASPCGCWSGCAVGLGLSEKK